MHWNTPAGLLQMCLSMRPVVATATWLLSANLPAVQVVEGKEEMDWTRHAAFVCFGFGYLGGVQYYLYNVKFVQWCGGITAQVGHVGVAPLKVFMDQAIQ